MRRKIANEERSAKLAIVISLTLNGGIKQPTFGHYCLFQGVFQGQEHPEEGSNAETSVVLYRY